MKKTIYEGSNPPEKTSARTAASLQSLHPHTCAECLDQVLAESVIDICGQCLSRDETGRCCGWFLGPEEGRGA
jgi:hypothetical protein